MKVAVTGGIGSGKSYVCNLLAKRGISIYNCDDEAKRLMVSSDTIHDKLICAVGEDVYCGTRVNKPVLAAFLLESADNAAIINGIVHPEVASDFMQSGKDWMECAILHTSGFDRLVDKVICVVAPLEVRKQRIMLRDSITESKAQEWIDCQMSQDKMAANSDFVIVNDGVADIDTQIEQILAALSASDN